MDFYQLVKPLLFQLEAEYAHDITLKSLKIAEKLRLLSLYPSPAPCKPRRVMGITFPSPVGLAAGLDKNGSVIDGMTALGFGFIEVGTVTPRPQLGNPKPRLFRVEVAQGVINRFGFNNFGVDQLIANVREAKYQGVLGINIGKNFDTPNQKAADDYLLCMRKVYAYASYITVNISSPNTKNLRVLQENNYLSSLLTSLKSAQQELAQQYGKYVPIALKVSPDLTTKQISDIASLLMQHQIDAVIATNTTISRAQVQGLANEGEAGGLSGVPVKQVSTKVIEQFAAQLKGSLPIIGVGGIFNGADASEKIAAGASLVQVYSGLIYRGPRLINDVCQAIG